MRDDDRGEYGLADEGPAAKRPAGRVPAQPSSPVAGVSRDMRAIPYATPVDESEPVEQFMERKVPMAMAAGGIAIELLFACWRLPLKEALWAAMRVGIETAVLAGLMMLVMWYASKARAFALGPIKVAGMKVLAISVGPLALTTVLEAMLRVVPLGWVVAWLLSFVLYFALLGALFSLEHEDTWYCIALIFIARVAIFVGMLLLAL